MDYTVHRILQARILEWVTVPFSRLSYKPRDRTQAYLHCRWILYQLSHQGSPRILEWVANPFSRGFSWPRNWTGVSCIASEFFYQLSYQGSPTDVANCISQGQTQQYVPSHTLLIILQPWCFLQKWCILAPSAWTWMGPCGFLIKVLFNRTVCGYWNVLPIQYPITSWQIDGETVETVSDFILGDSKITADGDCSHEIKRCLLLGRKVMTNLDSLLKSRDITLPTKACLVKAMVFPVVMYGCESLTIKKAKNWSILMLLNCGVGEDSWESLGLQGD